MDFASGDVSMGIKQKNSIKIILYFFQVFTSKAEQAATSFDATENLTKTKPQKQTAKSKGPNRGTNWTTTRRECLELFDEILSIDQSHLWTMGIVSENYLMGLWAFALSLLENRPQGVAGNGSSEIAVRDLCVEIVIKNVKLFSGASSSGAYSSLSAALVSATLRNDHMAPYVAKIATQAKGRLVPELFNEISNMNMASAEGVKNIACFIEEFAERDPELMASSLAIIKSQIDSPAFQIRLLTRCPQRTVYFPKILPFECIFIFTSTLA